MKRICKKCGKTKDVRAFNKDAAKPDGISYQCAQCKKEYHRSWCAKNYLKVRERQRQYNKVGVGLKCAREHSKRQHEKHRHRRLLRMRTYYLVRTGAITKTPCKICGDPEVQIHHLDYRSATKVEFYCKKHHAVIEGRMLYGL
jgi:hypothetical protein